jgi:hypothetical protein
MRGAGAKDFRSRQGSVQEILVERADDLFALLLM